MELQLLHRSIMLPVVFKGAAVNDDPSSPLITVQSHSLGAGSGGAADPEVRRSRVAADLVYEHLPLTLFGSFFVFYACY